MSTEVQVPSPVVPTREKNERQLQAAIRQAEYDALTPQQKLDRIDERLGKGVGAAKERARLAKKLAATT